MSSGACRYEVVAAPTEVVNSGYSEVLGTVILIVRGTGNFTGTFTGEPAQIGNKIVINACYCRNRSGVSLESRLKRSELP